MGHLAWFLLAVSGFVASPVMAAQGAATAAFPPARSPAAPAGPRSADAALPAAPPPPPAPAVAPAPSPPSAAAPSAPAPAAAPGPAPAPSAAPAAYPPPNPSYPGYPPTGYGYYYPPMMPLAKERYAETAAVSSAPFIDVLVASLSWQNRVSQFLNVGLQAGTYVAGHVRLTANVLLPTSTLNDDYYDSIVNYDSSSSAGYYNRQASKPVSLFYGFSAGIVAVSSPTFVMSPGIAFSRTDVSDYGSVIAFALPFEWVTGSGLRVGLEFDAGRAFGGVSHFQCLSNFGTGTDATCANGPTTTQDRPAGTSILLQFQLGFGFNHPDPLPPRPVQNAAPYGWPPPEAPAAAPTAPPAPVTPTFTPAPPPQ